MLTVSLDDTQLSRTARIASSDRAVEASAAVEPSELVEWEMSAGQVGSLVAAMGLVFGIVSLLA